MLVDSIARSSPTVLTDHHASATSLTRRVLATLTSLGGTMLSVTEGLTDAPPVCMTDYADSPKDVMEPDDRENYFAEEVGVERDMLEPRATFVDENEDDAENTDNNIVFKSFVNKRPVRRGLTFIFLMSNVRIQFFNVQCQNSVFLNICPM